MSSLGLRLEDEVVCVATGHRLGLSLCTSHVCQHCGTQMEQLGLHGLSCKKSQGRCFRHAAVSDIRKRSLDAAKIPVQQPSTFSRSDGILMEPPSLLGEIWENFSLGCHISDTFAPSYTTFLSGEQGMLAT